MIDVSYSNEIISSEKLDHSSYDPIENAILNIETYVPTFISKMEKYESNKQQLNELAIDILEGIKLLIENKKHSSLKSQILECLIGQLKTNGHNLLIFSALQDIFLETKINSHLGRDNEHLDNFEEKIKKKCSLFEDSLGQLISSLCTMKEVKNAETTKTLHIRKKRSPGSYSKSNLLKCLTSEDVENSQVDLEDLRHDFMEIADITKEGKAEQIDELVELIENMDCYEELVDDNMQEIESRINELKSEDLTNDRKVESIKTKIKDYFSLEINKAHEISSYILDSNKLLNHIKLQLENSNYEKLDNFLKLASRSKVVGEDRKQVSNSIDVHNQYHKSDKVKKISDFTSKMRELSHQKISVETLPHIKYDNPSKKVNVPGEGSCLLWCIAIDYLVGAESRDSFKKRYEELFGNDSPAKEHLEKTREFIENIRKEIKESTHPDVENNKEFSFLIENKLRSRLSEYMSKNSDNLKSFFDFNSEEDSKVQSGKGLQEIKSYEEYLDKLSDPELKLWSGSHEIMALSDMLKTKIVVNKPEISKPQVYGNSYNKEIEISHINENHYNFHIKNEEYCEISFEDINHTTFVISSEALINQINDALAKDSTEFIQLFEKIKRSSSFGEYESVFNDIVKLNNDNIVAVDVEKLVNHIRVELEEGEPKIKELLKIASDHGVMGEFKDIFGQPENCSIYVANKNEFDRIKHASNNPDSAEKARELSGLHSRAYTAYKKIGEAAGKAMHAAIMKDFIGDLLAGNFKGAAINASFFVGSKFAGKISEFAVMKGMEFAKSPAIGKALFGKSLRIAGQFISRAPSVFIIADLVNQIKDYQKGNKDALVPIIGNSIMLSNDAIAIGLELGEMAGFEFCEVAAASFGPIGEVIGAAVFIGMQIYGAVKAVEKLDEQVHLIGLEKCEEGIRAFFHQGPSESMEELLEEKQANNKVVQGMISFLMSHRNIRRCIKPSMMVKEGAVIGVDYFSALENFAIFSAIFPPALAVAIEGIVRASGARFYEFCKKLDSKTKINEFLEKLFDIPTSGIDNENRITELFKNIDMVVAEYGDNDLIGFSKELRTLVRIIPSTHQDGISAVCSTVRNIPEKIIRNLFKREHINVEHSDSYVNLEDKKTRPISVTRTAPGGDLSDGTKLEDTLGKVGSKLFCLPKGDDQPRSREYETYYECKNAIGLEYVGDNKDEGNTFVNLGGGDREVIGFQDKGNMFVLGAGKQKMVGGDKDDMFLFQLGEEHLEFKVEGHIDGRGGIDTLDVSDLTSYFKDLDGHRTYPGSRQAGEHKIYADFTQKALHDKSELSLRVENINNFIGREYDVDIVTASCNTKHIDPQGGVNKDHYDEIIISNDDACYKNGDKKREAQVVVWPYTKVDNHDLNKSGQFTYVIGGKLQGDAHISLDAKSESVHQFLFSEYMIQDIDLIEKSETGVSFHLLVKRTESSKFVLTIEGNPNKYQYIFGDKTIIVIGGNNLYAMQNTKTPIDDYLVREYSHIANKLHMNIVVHSNGQTLSVGHDSNDIVQNDAKTSMTHLVGNGGENAFIIESGKEKLCYGDLPISDVLVYDFGKEKKKDAISFQKIAEQVKEDLEDELKIVVSKDNQYLLITPYTSKKSNSRIITVRLKDAVKSHWYRAVEILTGQGVLTISEVKNNFELIPKSLVFDDIFTETYVISPDDVLDNSTIEIKKSIGSCTFTRDGETLILTNLISSIDSQDDIYVLLVGFYSDESKIKMESLTITFNDKKIVLRDYLKEIGNANDFDTIREAFRNNKYKSIMDSERRDNLLKYIREGNFDEVKKYVEDKDHGVAVNLKNSDGKTPLHEAVLFSSKDEAKLVDSRVKILDYLIRKGANIDARDDNGKTPLLLSIETTNQEVEDAQWKIFNHLVLVNGAKINTQYNVFELLRSKGYSRIADSIIKELENKLFNAVSNNNINEVKRLTNQGVDIDILNSDRKTLLHIAVQVGDLELVQFIVEKIKNPDMQDRNGKTAMHIAAVNNRTDIVICLVEEGANHTIKDADNKSPLNLLDDASRSRMVTFLRVNSGIRLINIIRRQGFNKNSDIKVLEIIDLLEQGVVDVNYTNTYGETPLYFAASVGDLDIIRHLIEKGANVNTKTKRGDNPLYISARNCNKQVFEHLLIEHIADNIHFDGKTPLDLFRENGEEEYARTVELKLKEKLFDEVNLGRLEDVKKRLAQGISVNVIDDIHNTPLHIAAKMGNLEMVKYLVSVHANINAQDIYGKTPLYCAAESHAGKKIIKYLIKKGSKLDLRVSKSEESTIDILNRSGHRTIVEELVNNLHSAVQKNLIKKVDRLINQGIDVNSQNSHGQTSLHIATRYAHLDMIKHLITVGANPNIKDNKMYTAIHYAAGHEESRSFEIVKYFIENANTNPNIPGRNGETLLHFAASLGNISVVKYLIEERGVEINAKDNLGLIPAHHAVKHYPSDETKSLEVINYLMKKDIVKTIYDEIYQIIEDLLYSDHHVDHFDDELKKVLAEVDIRKDIKNRIKEDWIVDIVEKENMHQEMIEFIKEELLKIISTVENKYLLHDENQDLEKDEIQIKEVVGKLVSNKILELIKEKYSNHLITPLNCAITVGNIKLIDDMVNEGININTGTKNISGMKPLPPLHHAVKLGNLEMVRYLIEEKHAELNNRNSVGDTPLYIAVNENKMEIAECLIFNDKSNTIVNNNLLLATERGNLEVIKFLTSSRIGGDVKISDSKVQTPLHIAVTKQNLELVSYLLYYRHADINVKDEKGDTPLECAISSGNVEIIDCILGKVKNRLSHIHYAVSNKHDNIENIRKEIKVMILIKYQE